MTDKDRYERARKKAEQRSKEIFAPAPKEFEEELEKETTLGNVENLAKPDKTRE